MQQQSRLSLAAGRELNNQTESRPEKQSPITGPSQASGSIDQDAGKPTQQPVATAKLSRRPAISTPTRRKIVSDAVEAVTVELHDDLPNNFRSVIKKHLHLAVRAAATVASSSDARAESESKFQFQKASASSPTSGRNRVRNRRNKAVRVAAVFQEATAIVSSAPFNSSVAVPAQLSSPIVSPQQPQEAAVGGGFVPDKPHLQLDPLSFRQAVNDGLVASNGTGIHGYYSQNRRPMPSPFYFPVGFSPVGHPSANGQMPFYPPHHPSFYSHY